MNKQKPQPQRVTVLKTVPVNNQVKNVSKRRRRNKPLGTVQVMKPGPIYPLPPAVSSKALYRSNIINKIDARKLTSEDMAFLKCAFAAPDFATTNVAGVPDQFNGMSLTKKHRSITSYGVTVNDHYILLSSVPGVAYFALIKSAGVPVVATDIFLPVLYSDFNSIFGVNSGNTADIVQRFRYVSNHIEIIPTTNQMNWTGNIQCFSMPVTVTTDQTSGTGADSLAVTGLQGCNSTNAQQYTAPFNLGCFAGAYNRDSTFKFSPIWEGVPQIPSIALPGTFGVLGLLPGLVAYPGFDNGMESILIKITGVTATESMLIKTWACVEYQISPGSGLYEYQTLSPCYNEETLKLYREIINSLPVAVTYMDNADFWNRVLSIIKRVSGVASVLPGPYGLVAGGVNAIATGIEELMF